ncbi:DEAD/DEAH box helicase family protein [Flavobacterium sp.]|uniref:DEAD/DEAH box helicase family protein n=1 Tax=Flavobacterium sp. TaxID=239 RepID=UPI0031D3A9B2
MLVNTSKLKINDGLAEYPKEAKFKYNWRRYQQRVLENLEEHLKDGHLHIIAPPGSGKTILGLEVALRLNKPTLILAPTIAIRNQWIQRFCELFLQTDQIPDWISRDIRNPKFMTVITYQGLHAACNNLKIEEEDFEEEEESEENVRSKQTNANLDKIVNGLNAQKIKTIVVDEAHHLKNEWWQTLTKVKEKINPVIVGLTATPPYDVSPIEWQRYIELNGLVDMEISVPELVIEGDLSPHQDYVYFTAPTEKEHQDITNFRDNIEMLFQEIKNEETIIQAIEAHPIWKNPEEHLDWIYNNFAYYSASLIFLKTNNREIPEIHLEVIGDKKIIIPVLDYEWTEKLLEFYLYKEDEHFKEFEEHRKTLENRLRRFGAIERRQIDFLYNRKVTGFLTSSISKLNGIKEIVDFEYNQLGKDLRMVILSDFIRKEYYVNSSENNLELNRLGVIPIFEKLRRENIENKKIGVLTGSIIIIPSSVYNDFEVRATNCGISKINSSIVPFDSNYVLIHQTEQLTHYIVHIVTQIFQSGGIEVLIGTKSLLGEGWDAPAINSLILASFVGSFVLSNQMRGRAIRTQNGNSSKTGNIWHLVTIDETSPTGGDDFDLLKRRFKSFVGVPFHEQPGIENGIGRLKLGENICEKGEAEKMNIEMFKHAANRENLKEVWKKALQTGVTLVEEIKIPFSEAKEYKAIKSMYLNKTLANLLATLGSGLASFGLEIIQEFLKSARRIRSMRDLYFFLTFFGIVGMLFFGRQTLKALRLYFKYRDISKDIKQIGEALLNSLIKARIIKTNYSGLEVIASVDEWGGVYCHLDGGSTFEKSIFINSLQEIISPIETPRYIIIRKNRFLFFKEQKDYHSVPEIIGRNKKLAEHFKQQWKELVGSCDLIFTRTIDGRKLILSSRIQSLATQFDKKAQRVNKWK